MNGTGKLRALLLLGCLMAVAFGLAPAHAASGGMTCEIVGNVHLMTRENLLTVDGGNGQLDPSNIACVGEGAGVSGTGSISGDFAFCSHVSATQHSSQCTGVVDWNGDGLYNDPPPQQQPEEPVYDQLGGVVAGNPVTAGHPLIAHVVARFSFTIGGIGCGFKLNGHTLGVVADLSLIDFSCTNGFTAPTNARAQALAIPSVQPGPFLAACTAGPIPIPSPIGGQPQACFQDLVFEGAMDVAST